MDGSIIEEKQELPALRSWLRAFLKDIDKQQRRLVNLGRVGVLLLVILPLVFSAFCGVVLVVLSLLGVANELLFELLSALIFITISVPLFPGLMAIIFAWVFYVSPRTKKLTAQQQKLDLVNDVIQVFDDDLHPDTRPGLTLDLRGYDLKEKQTWEGRSPHGNPKYRYRDRWLRLKVTLADRSRLIVVRHSKVKTKRSSVMKRTEVLVLKLLVDARRYPLPPNQWEMALASGEPVAKRWRPDSGQWECRLRRDLLNKHPEPEEIRNAARELMRVVAPYRV